MCRKPGTEEGFSSSNGHFHLYFVCLPLSIIIRVAATVTAEKCARVNANVCFVPRHVFGARISIFNFGKKQKQNGRKTTQTQTTLWSACSTLAYKTRDGNSFSAVASTSASTEHRLKTFTKSTLYYVFCLSAFVCVHVCVCFVYITNSTLIL